jgi:dTDP-4-amino-4,6-dideoxygalactose transaminase
VFDACQAYANCGRLSETDRSGRRGVGFNYRMTNLQAAVGLAQTERMDAIVAARRRLRTWYDERLRVRRRLLTARSA